MNTADSLRVGIQFSQNGQQTNATSLMTPLLAANTQLHGTGIKSTHLPAETNHTLYCSHHTL